MLVTMIWQDPRRGHLGCADHTLHTRGCADISRAQAKGAIVTDFTTEQEALGFAELDDLGDVDLSPCLVKAKKKAGVP